MRLNKKEITAFWVLILFLVVFNCWLASKYLV